VRLRTLVVLRWLAVAGQFTAILLLHLGFGYQLPLMPALVVVAASVVLNLWLSVRYRSSYRLGDRLASLYLTYDVLQLALLLYLTGGLNNPFAVLLLAPAAVAATMLTLRSAILVTAVVFASVSLLALFHFPLPWEAPGLQLSPLYLFGQWVAVVIGVLFLSGYLWRLAAESRRMSDALVATQLALAREQRMSAVGSLAAAAAHELGTPLGTIATAAKEMVRAMAHKGDLASDAKLIHRESLRCRDILGRIAQRPEFESTDTFRRQRLTSLLREAASNQERAGIEIRIVAPAKPHDPDVRRSLEILHGLTNLIENAVDFARSEVIIEAEVRSRDISVRVLDDGPGIPHNVLGALGEPYVSQRADGEGLGLGVFIAMTLLERTGARMTVSNRRGGGAVIDLIWPREALELIGKTE
jgi:two-component system sensor histidine kinase RegB